MQHKKNITDIESLRPSLSTVAADITSPGSSLISGEGSAREKPGKRRKVIIAQMNLKNLFSWYMEKKWQDKPYQQS